MAAAVAGLSPVQQRKVAAIVGACVGDAAAQPLHWIYKHDVLESVTGGREDVEFHNPSANPFYRLPTGSNSCYGDQAYVMLKSLVDNKGLDLKHLTKSTYDFFGPESAYENQEIGKYTVGKEDKINVKKTLPIEGPWRNGCVKDFIKNVDSNTTPTGSEKDDQIDCVIRIIPLVAMYAGAANMLEKVEAGSQVLQDLDLCVATSLAAARVLEQFILHGDPEDFLDTVIAQIKDPANPDPKELDKAVIGQIREVSKYIGNDHKETVMTHFKAN